MHQDLYGQPQPPYLGFNPYGQMYPPPPGMYNMPPDPYGYGGYFAPGYMQPPPDAGFGAMPPHMQGINPHAFPAPGAVPPPTDGTIEPLPTPRAGTLEGQSSSADAQAVTESLSALKVSQTKEGAPDTAKSAGAQPSADEKKAAGAPASQARDKGAVPTSASTPASTPAPSTSSAIKSAAPVSQTVPDPSDVHAPTATPAAAQSSSPAPANAVAPAKDLAPQVRQRPNVPGAPAGAKVAHRDASVPATDFDFEQANARFRKEGGGAAPSAKLDEIPAAPAYNKKSGFFDNLSSKGQDSYQRGRGGASGVFGDEKERNAVTFGDQAAKTQSQQRRPRNRGGRGGRDGRQRNQNNAASSKPEWA